MFQRSTLSRSVGCTDYNGFLPLESVTTSTISSNVQIRDDSQAAIHSKLVIMLIKTEPEEYSGFKNNIPKNTKHIQDFTYTYTPKVVRFRFIILIIFRN